MLECHTKMYALTKDMRLVYLKDVCNYWQTTAQFLCNAIHYLIFFVLSCLKFCRKHLFTFFSNCIGNWTEITDRVAVRIGDDRKESQLVLRRNDRLGRSHRETRTGTPSHRGTEFYMY